MIKKIFPICCMLTKHLYRWVTYGAGLALVCNLISCSGSKDEAESPVPIISETHELVVLVLNSPTTLYIDANGNYAGIEYELVTQFAALNHLKVRFVIVKNYPEMQQKLLAKEAHLAVGMVQHYFDSSMVFGSTYHDIGLSLIYPDTLTEKAMLADLHNKNTPVVLPIQYQPFLTTWQKHFKAPLSFQETVDEDNEALMAAVSEGKLPWAIVDSLSADVASNYYPHIRLYRIPNTEIKLAWALRSDDPELKEKVNRFFATIQTNQSLRHLQELYYGHINRLQPVDAKAFLRRSKTILPKYKRFFWEAEKATGIDWRLLAALAYQESHWDQEATSAYGVRGMMMLTNDTAERLGVTDRLDPFQSIMGGAHYIKKLENVLPDHIHSMDRHWLALAAYNVGMGHLNDARKIATWQKKNPDAWADVKTTLPLLRQYEYFSKTKNGYARGWEPVIFVESLRTYYDILARFEPPLRALAPAVDERIEIVNPDNRVLEINGILNI